MKKILLTLLIVATSVFGYSQTLSEISNILNSKPTPITSVSVSSAGTNIVNTIALTSTAYRVIAISISGTWVGGIQFQASNDTSLGWNRIQCVPATSLFSSWSDSIISNGTYLTSTLGWKYIRIRCTTRSSGTINSVCVGYLSDIHLPSPSSSSTVDSNLTRKNFNAKLSGQDSINLALIKTYATALYLMAGGSYSTTPGNMIMGAVDNTMPASTASGKVSPLWIDAATGGLKTTPTTTTTKGDVSVSRAPVAAGTSSSFSLDTLGQLRVTDTSSYDYLNTVAGNTSVIPDISMNSYTTVDKLDTLVRELINHVEIKQDLQYNKLDTLLSQTKAQKLKVDSLLQKMGLGIPVANDSAQSGTAPATPFMGRVRTAAPSLTNGKCYIPTLTAKGEQATQVLPDTVSGTITTQNLSPFRTATNNSAVVLNVYGYSSGCVQVRGSYTGALSLQGTVDDSLWVTINSNNGAAVFLKLSTNQAANTISSADTGIFTFNCLGLKKIRITGLAAMSGTATVTLSASAGAINQVYVNNSSANPVVIQAPTGSGGTMLKAENAFYNSGDAGPAIQAVWRDSLYKALTGVGRYGFFVIDKYGSIITKDEALQSRTYRASATFNPASSATDVFGILGVASGFIEVTKVIVTATQTTGGTFDITLLKRSTADGAGTAVTAVPLDAGDAAANATVSYYTSNPTTGSLVGNVETQPIFCSATTATPNIYTFDFGSKGKPVTLNSASQGLYVNCNGNTLTGGKFYITVEWRERL